jgi:hypothetical protein
MFAANLGLMQAVTVAPGDVEGLSAAIEQCRRGVEETPVGDDRLPHHLQILAICLNLRYAEGGRSVLWTSSCSCAHRCTMSPRPHRSRPPG